MTGLEPWQSSIRPDGLIPGSGRPEDDNAEVIRRPSMRSIDPRVWTFVAPKNAVDPHPSLRATLSHQERENNKWGCGSDRRFLPRRYHCVMKRLFVSLQVRALIRGSLPRPWGEGGRRPGEGQPTGIAPQNVQTPGPSILSSGADCDGPSSHGELP